MDNIDIWAVSPALFRGDVAYAFLIAITAIVTCGIMTVVWPFLYNKSYLKRLTEKGFKVVEADQANLALARSKTELALAAD